jgi:hypothetical protein
MRTRIVRLLIAAAAIASAATPAFAQSPGSGTVFHLSPYAGYMVFGNDLDGPLGTSLTNAPGMMYGTQLGLSLSPNLSLVGNIGYTTSSVQVGVPFLGGISVGSSSELIYDADLEYDFGGGKAGSLPISPFVQAGVGAMQYSVNESVLQTSATNPAVNGGIGADVTLSKGIALRLLAKDYVGKFNFQQATGLDLSGQTANNFAFTAGLRLDF